MSKAASTITVFCKRCRLFHVFFLLNTKHTNVSQGVVRRCRVSQCEWNTYSIERLTRLRSDLDGAQIERVVLVVDVGLHRTNQLDERDDTISSFFLSVCLSDFVALVRSGSLSAGRKRLDGRWIMSC